MYKIIGADQKEYGPVTADQVRQWIADGRANATTQVRAEGATEWRPLASFAEFADLLTHLPATPAPAAIPVPVGGTRESALQAVKGPAIGLIVISTLGLLGSVLGLAVNGLGMTALRFPGNMQDARMQQMFSSVGGIAGILQNLLGLAVGALILIGAMRMLNLRSYKLAFTASILAMIPCLLPCCLFLVSIPFGIWAVILLNRPDVKAQFTP